MMVTTMVDQTLDTTMEDGTEASMMVTTMVDQTLEITMEVGMEEASMMVTGTGDQILDTTMDKETEASMMVTGTVASMTVTTTTTEDQTLDTTIMDSGMGDSTVVAITDGRMGASILETIIITMDNGTGKKVKDIIPVNGMVKKAMVTIRRMEGQTWVSSLVSPSGWWDSLWWLS